MEIKHLPNGQFFDISGNFKQQTTYYGKDFYI